MEPGLLVWFPDAAANATWLILLQLEPFYGTCGNLACALSIYQYADFFWFANWLSLFLAWCILHGSVTVGKGDFVRFKVSMDECNAYIQVATEICAYLLSELHVKFFQLRVLVWFLDAAANARWLMLLQQEPVCRTCGDLACALSIYQYVVFYWFANWLSLCPVWCIPHGNVTLGL